MPSRPRSSASSTRCTQRRGCPASACRGSRPGMNANDLSTLLPELALTILVLLVLSVDLFLRREQKWLLTPITVGGLIVVGIAWASTGGITQTLFAGFHR